MPKKPWFQICLINSVISLIILSPFLPGPNSLSSITNSMYIVAQLLGILLSITIPIGIIVIIRERIKKKRISLTLLLSWSISTTIFTMSMYGAIVARSFSRNIAIKNAEPIVDAINSYHAVNKKYPEQLSDLIPRFISAIPNTGIMGIANYEYEKREKGFVVIFSQNVILNLNKEVVSYDPTYQYSNNDKENQIYQTGNDKWQYYILD